MTKCAAFKSTKYWVMGMIRRCIREEMDHPVLQVEVYRNWHSHQRQPAYALAVVLWY